MVLSLIVLMFGYFAAFLFAASRGDHRTELGFFEALGVSFKLIGELAMVVIGAIIFIVIGFYTMDTIGVLFMLVGTIALWMFPLAAQFYIVDYIVERRKGL